MHNVEELQCNTSTLLYVLLNMQYFFLSDKHKWILYNSRIYTDIFITQVETCTIILSSSCFSHFSMLPLYDAHCHTIYKYTQ